jgi:hypothetical protein
MKTKPMFKSFKLTDEEYIQLEKKFGQLCKYQAWQLLRKNAHNNHTDELEDIEQDLLIAMVKAGVYYKRQMYIESCLKAATKHARDKFVKDLVEQLAELWKQRTKHGANKQKYGEYQEKLLESIVRQIVPENERPDPKRPLVMDSKFATYCKQITWNQQKSLGRKITRERSIRSGLTSLSEYDYVSCYSSME